jgi:hypothetical protein
MTGNVDTEITKISSEGEKVLSDGQEFEGWRTRSDLTLIIENVPSYWMVGDLKSFLDGFGTIVKVEIFEDREVFSSPKKQDLTLDWKRQWGWDGRLSVIPSGSVINMFP